VATVPNPFIVAPVDDFGSSWTFNNTGTRTTNFATITNQWNYVQNNVTQLTLTNGSGGYDMYLNTPNSYAGQQITVKVWVKLGTAGNFCLVLNNAGGWNTIGGFCYTNANSGINSSTYTQITLTKTMPSSASFNLNVGAHLESITQQLAGTVYVYGWEITFTNAPVNVIGNISCSSLLSSGNVSCCSNLNVGGSVSCASVLGVAGNVSCCSNLNVGGGISCASNLNVAGNITFLGTMTGATLANASYCLAPLYAAVSLSAGTTDLSWGALTLNTSDITHTSNTGIFSFANAGIYQVTFSLVNSNASGTPYAFVSLQRSTNSGSTWSALCAQGGYITYSYPFNYTFSLVSIAAGDQWKLVLYNNASITLQTTTGTQGIGQAGSVSVSYVHFHRVA
jgi:hypothetical protein